MNGIEIYRKYIGGHYNIGDAIKSPFPASVRKPDSKPSFSTYIYKGIVVWKDFALDKTVFGNGPLGFVCLMEGVDKEEAKRIVESDGFRINTRDSRTFVEKLFDEKIPLVFSYSDLRVEHYRYFDKLFVSPSILKLYGYHALNSVIKSEFFGLVGGTVEKKIWRSTESNFGFYNKIGSGNKAYMPFNQYYTGMSKVLHQGIDILEGYDQLPPTGKLLIITKSLKDVATLRACGYWAICCSSENSLNIFLYYFYELFCRFDNIVVWGDNDKVGRIFAQKIKRLLPSVKIAESIIAKDPSDIAVETNTQFYINLVIDRALAS